MTLTKTSAKTPRASYRQTSLQTYVFCQGYLRLHQFTSFLRIPRILCDGKSQESDVMRKSVQSTPFSNPGGGGGGEGLAQAL